MWRERWVQAFVLWLGALVIIGWEGSILASPTNLEVTSYADLVRFTIQGDVKDLRVEILTLAGQKIVDSGIIKGSALDWRLGDQQWHLVASGVYLYVVTVKDTSGKLSKYLGKLAVVQGKIGSNQAPGLSLPTVGILAGCRDCEPPAPRWQELLDDAGSDNFRLIRLSQTLLTLDNVGRLSVPQLCLSGDCRSSWPGAGTSGWVDDGAIVRLATDTDNVGIGTPTPTEKLTVGGNVSVTGTIDSVGQMSKIRFHYNTLAELPDPNVYHGMFAHVHDVGKAYFAHAGAWVELQQRVSGSCATGNASESSMPMAR